MSMVKVILRDGSQMQFEADTIGVGKAGALMVSVDAKYPDGRPYSSPIAIFAHGIWSHYLWVKMEG